MNVEFDQSLPARALSNTEAPLNLNVAHWTNKTNLRCSCGTRKNTFDLFMLCTRLNVRGLDEAAVVVITHKRKLAKSSASASAQVRLNILV